MPRKYITNTFLILISTLVSLGIIEAVANLILGPIQNVNGIMFVSRNTFQSDGEGYVRYSPKSTIRELSIFGNKTEYDVKFSTNNFGFIDSKDYPLSANNRNIAVVGDSFTSGHHGGAPWVPRLREKLKGVGIYNFGINGTGIEQFTDLLIKISKDLKFNEILIVAISHDPTRRRWRPVEKENKLYMCRLENEKCSESPTVSPLHIFDKNQTASYINESVDIFYKKLQSKNLRKYLSRQTYIGRSLHIRKWRKSKRPGKLRQMPGFSVESFKKLRNYFKELPITLVHLPMKNETLNGAYSMDMQSVVAPLNIRYIDGLQTCNLTMNDYFSLDSHPNDKGYDKILDCVAGVLTGKHP